jgi:mRNA interferase HigB
MGVRFTRIISVGTLKAFWDQPAHRHGATAYLGEGGQGGAMGRSAGSKQVFGTADILRDGRVVFDIGGNKYRLVAWVNYRYGVVYLRFIRHASRLRQD